jgi:hypothetical protein
MHLVYVLGPDGTESGYAWINKKWQQIRYPEIISCDISLSFISLKFTARYWLNDKVSK